MRDNFVHKREEGVRLVVLRRSFCPQGGVVRPGRWATPKNERKKKWRENNEGGAVPKAQTLKRKEKGPKKIEKEKKTNQGNKQIAQHLWKYVLGMMEKEGRWRKGGKKKKRCRVK